MRATNLTDAEKGSLLQKIETISEKYTVVERNFTDAMVEGSWKMRSYLIFLNIFFILIIISCVGIYFSIMMKKLLESTIEIKLKNENLILANTELDRFVYSASHSPLTSLKGLIQIAKEEKDREQINYYFDLMEQSITRQDQFITDIIDYSRNKRIEKNLKTVNLHLIIDDVVQQFGHDEITKNIEIEKKLEIDEIRSDALRLKIIFNNLISNAIKYGDPKKEKKKIEIQVFSENEVYKIVVKDNGMGIEEEVLPRIFEMFFGTNHNIGSGLGLYITMEAVQVLSGTITASSQKNEGTILLLLYLIMMQTNSVFLLIEDNLIDQLITTKLLKNTFDHFEFNVVSNGKQGLDWLDKFNYTHTNQLIILLDIKMPQMDGFEFLSHYEALPEELKKKTQIFMLSSTLDPNDIKRATENFYVKKLFSKPLAVSEFKEIITLN